ncbi:MAG TPA: TonB-dependent siderophore receptor, partial [Pyrinomonadaceae bacterium]|nr:TonB-dependent siderophore receptor [Pyrinomonadaceae bacterium]
MNISIRKATKKRKLRAKGRRGPRYWVIALGTTGAIIAFTFGGCHRMMVGYAAERNGAMEITRNVNDNFATLDFNIPAGTLETVLDAFQKRTRILVNVENDTILSIASPGVIGNFTVEAALKQLLTGTGVSYIFRDARSVLLTVKAQEANVEIRGVNTAVVSSPKYSEPLRDTPQTINVIPKEVIEQQGATTLRDVLNNVPGITFTAGEGGAPAGDNLTIRGFSGRNDIYIDGVRDLGAQSRDSFNMEQVEVVKGPSSTFTGRGSTGGTINLVSKLPNLRRSFAGTLSGGSDSTKRATADINLPFSDSIAFRLNALAHNSDFPGRSDVQYRRLGIAPSIIFGLGTRTRYSFAYFHINQDNISDYGIPWVPATNNALIEFRDRPAPVPRSTFYGFLDRDKEKLRADQITARFEHEFDDNITIRNQFRYGYSRRDSIASPPRFANNNSTAINREMRSWQATDDIYDNQTDVTARFKTGDIEHSAVFGGSFAYEKNHRLLRSAPNSPTTLLDPNPNDTYTGVITIDPRQPDAAANTAAGYFFDTIKFSKQWEFVGGLRWDYFDVSGLNTATVNNLPVLVPIERTDKIFSGQASLIFKPIESGSIYASFGTSANPSLEGLLYAPAGTNLDPEKTRTYEIGTKWDLFGSKLLLSSALFQVNKTDARTTDSITGLVSLDGNQRVRGIEVSATGNITRNWQVFSGYTLLDSEIIESLAFTDVLGIRYFEQGKELINTPRNSFNLWMTYRWDKFFFGGGARFIGERFGNNVNTRFVDNYWVA